MNIISVFKLVLSKTAFLEAELDHIEAKRKAGEAYQSAEEFRDEALARIVSKRRNMLKSAIWLVVLISLGGIGAMWVNATDPLPWFWIRIIRAISVMLLAWAVWAQLGDVKTFKGETLLELTSQCLYKFTYSMGILVGSFTLFLEGTNT